MCKICLSFPKQQILDSSKLKDFVDVNFKFDENGKKESLQLGIRHCGLKGEIAS